MNAQHWIAFFQAIGIIGAMHVNVLTLKRQEDTLNFWRAFELYDMWEESQL